jgi:hypothetical protein
VDNGKDVEDPPSLLPYLLVPFVIMIILVLFAAVLISIYARKMGDEKSCGPDDETWSEC